MEEGAIIMAALATLSSSKLSDLTNSILSLTHRHRHRLFSLLSSPSSFSLTLHHLHSLSLTKKTLLIARHLLSSLQLLSHQFQPSSPQPYNPIKLRDLDTVLLLLLLCEVHQQNPEALNAPLTKWQIVLSKLYSDTLLTLSGVGAYKGAVLIPYIEMVTRCRSFLSVMGDGRKAGGEVAAAPAAVVALPSVQVRGGGVECVICKEDMREGRDVCELPCEHLFHWMCVLPWLRKRNTCPCCRFRLPSDDVLGEIERLWKVLIKVSCRSFDRECMGFHDDQRRVIDVAESEG